ncbi:MAG: hypothetical protein ACR2QO_00020 [Acidimicrobiales bacterium]
MIAARRGPPATRRLRAVPGASSFLTVSLAVPTVPNDSAAVGARLLAATEAVATGGATAANNDWLVIVGVVAVVALGVALLALLQRASRTTSTAEPSRPGHGGDSGSWGNDVRKLCAEGRSIVELTTKRTGEEPGSGLSMSQLGQVESRLDVLVIELDEAEVGAPSPVIAQSLRIAAVEARNLKDLTQTERRLRLTSVHPSMALLDATALQLTKARTSLDQTLRDLSRSITELD